MLPTFVHQSGFSEIYHLNPITIVGLYLSVKHLIIAKYYFVAYLVKNIQCLKK